MSANNIILMSEKDQLTEMGILYQAKAIKISDVVFYIDGFVHRVFFPNYKKPEILIRAIREKVIPLIGVEKLGVKLDSIITQYNVRDQRTEWRIILIKKKIGSDI